MSAQTIQGRITTLFESLKQTKQLIIRLSKFPSQPGSSPSNPDEGDARVELSTEIHQSLKEQEEDFELLRQEAEDQTSSSSWPSAARRRDSVRDRERVDLAGQVTRLGEDLKIARVQFRKAQLQAKRNAEAAKRKERELLFAGVQEGNATAGYGRRKGQEKLSQEELLLNASSDVTTALRRTHNLMTAELERSQFARETLENSTKELSTLSESYSNLETLLSSSRNLVSTLIHSQKSDTWYLESAFYILAVTIAWLVFRRIIYGPGWWILYFPLKTLWFVVRLLTGSLSAIAGVAGAKNQSISLSQTSEQLPTRLTGKAGIPTFPPDMAAPSIRVGGGGHGAKAEHASMSDQVGQMAEESQQGNNAPGDTQEHREKTGGEAEPKGTVLRERRADELPNPKKRMWEEPVGGDVAQDNRPRDEL